MMANSKNNNQIIEKSYAFALRVVKLASYLKQQKREYVLSNQVLRSGTSIGANVEEAMGGASERDFENKLRIAYKEARETRYWLRLLQDSETLEADGAESMLGDLTDVERILSAILVTLKQKSNGKRVA